MEKDVLLDPDLLGGIKKLCASHREMVLVFEEMLAAVERGRQAPLHIDTHTWQRWTQAGGRAADFWPDIDPRKKNG